MIARSVTLDIHCEFSVS